MQIKENAINSLLYKIGVEKNLFEQLSARGNLKVYLQRLFNYSSFQNINM